MPLSISKESQTTSKKSFKHGNGDSALISPQDGGLIRALSTNSKEHITPSISPTGGMTEEQEKNASYVIQHQAPWAKFSKGTGARILCAQNYIPNSGLGIGLQGRVVPIAQEKQPQYHSRRGIGYDLGQKSHPNIIHELQNPDPPPMMQKIEFVQSNSATPNLYKEPSSTREIKSLDEMQQISTEGLTDREASPAEAVGIEPIGEEETIELEYVLQCEEGPKCAEEIQSSIDTVDHSSPNQASKDNLEEDSCGTGAVYHLQSYQQTSLIHNGSESVAKELAIDLVPVFHSQTGERVAEVSPSPESPNKEDVLYILQMLKLENETCLTFFDTGADCNLVLGEMAMRLKLREVSSRPMHLKGAGNKTMWSNFGTYEFMIGPTRNSGEDVHIYAQGMPEITSFINRFELESLEKEALDSDEVQTELSGRVFPKYVGGQAVSLLIGLNMTNIMPIMKHCLPNGLALFEAQLPDMFGSYICFGGPHHVFTQLNKELSRAPYKQTVCFLQEVVSAYINSPYVQISRSKDIEEDDFIPGIHWAGESKVAQIEEELLPKLCECEIHVNQRSDSGNDIQKGAHTVKKTGKWLPLSKRKVYVDTDDLGLDAQVRCEECATCPKCSLSAKERMISIQERHEQDAIRKSIRLDLDNKKVMVGYPFTRDPVEFLTAKFKGQKSNFNQANRMFKSICRVKDQATKTSLIQAHKNLVDMGFMVSIDDLNPNQRKIIDEAKVKHYMTWTVAEKPGGTTPYRFVVDASITGLNEILAKGENTMIRIPELLIKNRCKKYAWSSDITKLYNQLHLEDEALPYGLFLFSDDLHPESPPKVFVMLVAWYGVSSTGNQAKEALTQLATVLNHEFPLVLQIVKNDIYVDDALPGSNDKEEREQQIQQTRDCFARGGFKLKYVIRSGEVPDPEVVDDQGRMKILGYYWYPEADRMSPGFDEVNFNRKKKGAKRPNPFIVRTADDVDKLLSSVNLTKRKVASKLAEIYDPCGFVEAYKIQWKLENRHLAAYDWDQELPLEVVDHWKGRMRELVELINISWPRCVIPEDAVDPSSIRLIAAADAATEAAGCMVYACYQKRDGLFSSELLTSRSKLVNFTIPRNELEGVRMMAQTMAILRRTLTDIKIEEHYFTDSTVAMCWCANTSKKLKMYVLTRVAEIRRNILGESFRANQEELPLSHIEGSMNPADMLTKSHNILPSDLTSVHRWFRGDLWMTKPSQLLPGTSFGELCMTAEEESEVHEECFNEPIISAKNVNLINSNILPGGEEQEMIHCAGCSPSDMDYMMGGCRGTYDLFQNDHCDNCACERKVVQVSMQNRDMQHTGTDFHEAISKFGWVKGLNIATRIMRMIHEHRHERHCKGKRLNAECFICPFKENNPQEEDLSRLFKALAIDEIFREESRRLKSLLPSKKLEQFQEKDGILLFQSRVVHQFSEEDLEEDTLPFLDQHMIQAELPVVGSDSPIFLAYVNYIHFRVRRHAGVDTTLGEVTKFCWPINNPKRIIHRVRSHCSRCRIIARRTLELRMQNLPANRMLLAPVFYSCQIDVVFGFKAQPCPGSRRPQEMWALILVCTLTGATNILVMEGLSTRDVVQAIERHSSRYGIPGRIQVDNGTNLMKLKDVSFSMRRIQLELQDLANMEVTVTVPKAHEDQGRVERRVRELRRCLEQLRDTAPPPKTCIAWETTFAQISNQLNDLPMPKSNRSRIEDPFWDVLTPNRLILGRNNNRSLHGRMKIDYGPDLDLLVWKNKQIMSAWFKIFVERLHYLMPGQNKWTASSKFEKGDVVLFLMDDARFAKDEQWRLGRIEKIVSPTRVLVKYFLVTGRKEPVMKILERRPRQLSLVTKGSEPSTQSLEFQKTVREGIAGNPIQPRLHGKENSDAPLPKPVIQYKLRSRGETAPDV